MRAQDLIPGGGAKDSMSHLVQCQKKKKKIRPVVLDLYWVRDAPSPTLDDLVWFIDHFPGKMNMRRRFAALCSNPIAPSSPGKDSWMRNPWPCSPLSAQTSSGGLAFGLEQLTRETYGKWMPNQMAAKTEITWKALQGNLWPHKRKKEDICFLWFPRVKK